ncbi:FecCD family ABC transporter permease [Gracilibacillus kekensis]|uniref:Iron complex transport system permease protein n=1 Tax=Gracilibacillus kekensis TaxID=1027249 RepID=A0A1M7LFW4_9BACI|nr:iron ABC transporter permease [Gracilibacillus kekensis]SHM77035.1 iron complex transport system permease protein [Gracilibacillus kekensis]
MESVSQYSQIIRRRKQFLFILAIVFVVIFIIDIMVGSSSLTMVETVKIIFEGPKENERYNAIIWGIRLPMALTCVCVGASLGLAGVQMQTILNNPLASPYTLGVSSAAGFGAAFSIVFGFPYLSPSWINIPVSAMIFSLLASAMIALASKRMENNDTKSMILFGVIMNFFFAALQTLMQYISNQSQTTEILHWLFGSLAKANWLGVLICSSVFLIIFLISLRYNWQLTALSVGEDRAKSLGIRTNKLRIIVFILSALLIAAAVSYVGSIGFIGLVAPHFARTYMGEDQRYLAPMSAFFGVILLLTASILSKIVIPGIIIPVGIITNLVGVGFLAYLMLRRKI